MGLTGWLRSKHEKGYRVHHYDPVKKRLLWALFLVALVGAGWGLYRLGFSMSGYAQSEAYRERHRLLEQIAFLEGENERLTQRAATLERGQAIAGEANDEVKDSLNKMEAELLELKEELSFYRSIVSPSSMEPGLHVQSFQLEHGESERQYLYKLVLTLVRGNDRVARGEVQIKVEGLDNGLPKTLSLAELVSQGSGQLKFSFKYFQSVEGMMVLPEGFEPQRISIMIKPTSGRLDPVEATFDWANTVVGDSA